MSVDLAQLGVQVHTSSVKAGGKDLDEFSKKAKSAEESAKFFEREIDRLENKFNPLATAVKRYKHEIDELKRAKKLGVITSKQYAEDLLKLEQGLRSATVATGKLYQSAGQRQFVLKNLAFQLNQIGQQGAVTGNYLGALSIQLPDILASFGFWGVLIGGATAVLGPMVMEMAKVGDEGKKLVKMNNKLRDSAATYTSIVDQQNQSLETQRVRYGKAAEAARKLLEQQVQLAEFDVQKKMGDALALLTEDFGDLGRVSADNFDLIINRSDEYLAKARELQTAIREGDTERRAALTQEIIELGQLPDLVANVADAYNISRDAAQGVLVAAKQLQDTASFEDQARAAADLAQEIWEAYGGLEGMPEDVRKLWQGLTDAGIEAAKLAGMDMTSPISDAADEATRLVEQLGLSVELANKIANIGVVNGNTVQGFDANDPRNPKSKAPIFTNPTDFNSPGYNRKKRRGGGTTRVNEAEREAQKIYEATRTELEKYNAELERLDELHEQGYLSADTYARAIDKAKEKYEDATEAAAEFKAMQGILKDAILDFAEDGADAMDSLGAAIRRAALEALLFGEGPLSGLLGGLVGDSGILGGATSSLSRIFSGKRANGGDVQAGRVYEINERGTEAFVPQVPGYVLSHQDAKDAFGGGKQASPVVFRPIIKVLHPGPKTAVEIQPSMQAQRGRLGQVFGNGERQE
ncbi:hypothetical protein NBRC116590_02700 [Pelagimonas sp. KU-00592-HH]|uniref:hypothetical protein n=1 Tax=Pelagimonas sp. KU-00592-HH TaxID=3127651 RepID=UPI003107A387